MHPVHTFTSYFPKIHFNNIFTSTPSLLSGLLPSDYNLPFSLHSSLD